MNKILICDPLSQCKTPVLENMVRVESLIECLNRATSRRFDRIVVWIGTSRLRERNALLELCAALKKNPHSEMASITAVLADRHRKVMESLNQSGVEYVKFLPKGACPSEDFWRDIVRFPSDAERIDLVLGKICPYLNYSPVSERLELMTCGAYRNRLVLGPPMLKKFCHVPNHVRCPYFNDPKPPATDR